MHGIGMHGDWDWFLCTATWKGQGKKVVFGDFLRGYTAMESLERIRLFRKTWKTRLENLSIYIYIYIDIFVFFERCTWLATWKEIRKCEISEDHIWENTRLPIGLLEDIHATLGEIRGSMNGRILGKIEFGDWDLGEIFIMERSLHKWVRLHIRFGAYMGWLWILEIKHIEIFGKDRTLWGYGL